MAKKSKKDLELEKEEEKKILNLMNGMKCELENIGKNLEEMIKSLRDRNFSINRLKDLSIVINAKDINEPLLEKALIRLCRT